MSNRIRAGWSVVGGLMGIISIPGLPEDLKRWVPVINWIIEHQDGLRWVVGLSGVAIVIGVNLPWHRWKKTKTTPSTTGKPSPAFIPTHLIGLANLGDQAVRNVK